MKRITRIHPSPPIHWVGDGFPVSGVFSPRSVGDALSPFLLLDYAGPARFEPSEEPRGVGPHPHRGFETVTVVYQGELEHGDSAGNRGRLGAGDVQWMTAGAGVFHEELHSRAFARAGGVLEMAQLWVNLPARHKRVPPRYQDLASAAIPTIALAGGRGSARVVAGELAGVRGAAATLTPVLLWDVTLGDGAAAELPLPQGWTAAVYVRSGAVELGGERAVRARELAVFARDGAGLAAVARGDAALLVLGGEPIDEPVAAYGPFVMSTAEEIEEAIRDVRSGKLGWPGRA